MKKQTNEQLCVGQGHQQHISRSSTGSWKVLIVDDESTVHQVTRLALQDFTFAGRGFDFLNAYSAQEAITILNARSDIALVLLDVVMETENAGLRVVRHIRETLANTATRIILRTGHPGQAPEREVVTKYDINDYKEKTELTAAKLFTTVYTAVRTYRDICALQWNRKGLEKIIDASATIFRNRDLSEFAKGVLEQLISLLYLEPDAVYFQTDGVATASSNGVIEIIAATGHFAEWIGAEVSSLGDSEVIEAIKAARGNKTHVLWRGNLYATYFKTDKGYENIICVKGSKNTAFRVNRLIDLFLRNVSIAFENIYLHRDLSQEIAERREAERSADLLARLPGELPEPVMRVTDAGVISYANQCSKPIQKLFGTRIGSRLPEKWRERLREILDAGRRLDLELTQDERIYEISFSPVSEAGYLNIFGRDVTEYRQLLERLKHAAYHDYLTGLSNRLYFKNHLEQAVMMAGQYNGHIGLMMVDLNHFKQVNDVWGHEAGDLALKAVASRLQRIVRGYDVVARLGGDEFGIVLTRLEGVEEMTMLAERILDELARPIDLGERDFTVLCSIGLTSFPEDARNAEDLQRCADLAMYHAKNDRSGGFRYYDSEIHKKMRQKANMELRLRHALDAGCFEVFYQPLVDIDDGEIIGAEALLRLRRTDNSLILPGCFIGVAEETGLIEPIGQWVLNRVCADLNRLLKSGLDVPSIALNVSAKQFRNKDLPKHIAQTLNQFGIPPRCLELEITESMLFGEEESALKLLDRLREIGLLLTIDDFGTGYSSLSYLRRLPVAKLKIDRSFVADMLISEDAAAIVDAILSLGHSLRLRVLGEGIEREEQVNYLRERACKEGQGFFFGKPVPTMEFKRLLESNGSK
jgi:diguanylate cyclase (GGDEF)-like protein